MKLHVAIACLACLCLPLLAQTNNHKSDPTDPCGFRAAGVRPEVISVALQQPDACHIHLSMLGVPQPPRIYSTVPDSPELAAWLAQRPRFVDRRASGVSNGIKWKFHRNYFLIPGDPSGLTVTYRAGGRIFSKHPKPVWRELGIWGMVETGYADPDTVILLSIRDNR